MLRVLVVATLGVTPFGPPAAAQSAWQVDASAAARANAGTVTIISGGIDGTYIRVASDLAAVLDDGATPRILPVLGKGSLQNIADILYLRGVDIGIVQSDVLAFVRQRHLYPNIEQSVQYIAKLYDEEVHVLVRKDITRIEDLAGQKVNVDLAGSGTAMTASLMFEQLGVQVQATNLDQPTALEKLRLGELAAIVFVSGQPVRLFLNIPPDSGLHFVSVPLTDQLAQTYLPAELSHASYPSLVDDGAPVATIAVGSVMAVFAFPPSNERYGKIARFIDAFFAKFAELLKPPRHPKWKDVNLAASYRGAEAVRACGGCADAPAHRRPGNREPARRACRLSGALGRRRAPDRSTAWGDGSSVPQGAGTGNIGLKRLFLRPDLPLSRRLRVGRVKSAARGGTGATRSPRLGASMARTHDLARLGRGASMRTGRCAVPLNRGRSRAVAELR